MPLVGDGIAVEATGERTQRLATNRLGSVERRVKLTSDRVKRCRGKLRRFGDQWPGDCPQQLVDAASLLVAGDALDQRCVDSEEMAEQPPVAIERRSLARRQAKAHRLLGFQRSEGEVHPRSSEIDLVDRRAVGTLVKPAAS